MENWHVDTGAALHWPKCRRSPYPGSTPFASLLSQGASPSRWPDRILIPGALSRASRALPQKPLEPQKLRENASGLNCEATAPYLERRGLQGPAGRGQRRRARTFKWGTTRAQALATRVQVERCDTSRAKGGALEQAATVHRTTGGARRHRPGSFRDLCERGLNGTPHAGTHDGDVEVQGRTRELK
jgi:hypothetical protein